MIPFGEWLPDQPALGNPGATIAKNVIPYAQAYGQLRGLSSFGSAVNEAVLGSVWAKSGQGNFHNHIGTSAQLQALQADGTWDNISKPGNYSNVTDWEWTQVGDRMIAVNLVSPTQYYDLDTSSTYLDLPGSPPSAAHIASVRNFTVLGNIDDGSDYPSRIQWSGYNNTEIWTPSRATQSDRRDLAGRGGVIQRIVPGQYGVVFQENSIWVMQYAGNPTIFTLSEVEKGRGTPAPKSVCWTGDAVYFLSTDGFYRFTDRAEPIGAERVDRWFFNEVDSTALDRVRGVVDRSNKLVLFTFPSSGTLAYNDRIAIYNWGADKWSYGELNTEVISEYVTDGLSLDDLTGVLGDIDSGSIPVDSTAYLGGALALVAFDENHQISTFQGDPLAACIETVEAGDGKKRTHIRRTRPLVDATSGANITLQHGTRNSQNETVVWGAQKPLNSLGEADMRVKSRYARFRANISGGFTNAIGIDITESRQAGRK